MSLKNNKRLKIVLFSNWFFEYMFSFAKGMASLDHEILLMLPDTIDKKYDKLRESSYNYCTYKYVDYRSIRDIYKMTKDINQKIRNFNPDIVHIQSNGHPYFMLNFLTLRKYKIVNTVHDPKKHKGDPTYINDDLLWWFSRRYTDIFITHGEIQKNDLIQIQNLNPKKVFTTYHGHLGIYRKFNNKVVKEEKNTILFMGRIWDYKGLDDFIKASYKVIERIPNCKFIIAGKGDDFEKYEALIKHPSNFELHNKYIPVEEIPILFQRSSIVVLPYKEATQSGIIPVAYAFGKPVIATRVGSIPEVVLDGKTGFLVPPETPDAISNAIITFLSDNTKQQAMKNEAKKMTQTLLSWEEIAKQITNYYIQ